MFIHSILFIFVISFLLHFYFAFKYITTRLRKYITLYLFTAVNNILISGLLVTLALLKPELIRSIQPGFLFWIISGIISAFALFIQISILIKIYIRAQIPENFHKNFFGKKVLHSSVVKPSHLLAFLIAMPFLLLAGSYFVARLINIILYGHL